MYPYTKDYPFKLFHFYPIWICFSTPLHYAAANGHMDIIMKLVEYNADVDIEDFAGTNAYEFAVAYGHMDAAEYLESLWS